MDAVVSKKEPIDLNRLQVEAYGGCRRSFRRGDPKQLGTNPVERLDTRPLRASLVQDIQPLGQLSTLQPLGVHDGGRDLFTFAGRSVLDSQGREVHKRGCGSRVRKLPDLGAGSVTKEAESLAKPAKHNHPCMRLATGIRGGEHHNPGHGVSQ